MFSFKNNVREIYVRMKRLIEREFRNFSLQNNGGNEDMADHVASVAAVLAATLTADASARIHAELQLRQVRGTHVDLMRHRTGSRTQAERRAEDANSRRCREIRCDGRGESKRILRDS